MLKHLLSTQNRKSYKTAYYKIEANVAFKYKLYYDDQSHSTIILKRYHYSLHINTVYLLECHLS